MFQCRPLGVFWQADNASRSCEKLEKEGVEGLADKSSPNR